MLTDKPLDVLIESLRDTIEDAEMELDAAKDCLREIEDRLKGKDNSTPLHDLLRVECHAGYNDGGETKREVLKAWGKL